MIVNKLERIKRLEEELASLRKDIEKEDKASTWSIKGGEYYVDHNGVVSDGCSTNICREYGVEFENSEDALKANKVYRRFHRLYKLQQELDNGWVQKECCRGYEILTIDNGKISYVTTYTVTLGGICFESEESVVRAIEIIKAGGL